MVHLNFDPDTVDWRGYFESQTGAGFIFEGLPYQRGFGIGSIFGNLFRFLLPIGKSIGQEFGREALATGGRIAKNIGGGTSLKEALKKETNEGLKHFASKAIDSVYQNAQSGNGRKSIKGKRFAGKASKKGPRKRIDYLGPY